MKNLTINQASFGAALLLHATLLLIPAGKNILLPEAAERIEFRFISPVKADIAEPREVQSKPEAPAQELKQQRPIEQVKQVVSSVPAAPVTAPAARVEAPPSAAVKAAVVPPSPTPHSETRVGAGAPESPPQQVTSRAADGQSSGRSSAAPRKEITDPGRGSRLGEYLAQVRAKVEAHKEYPSSARQMGYQGTVTVRVTIKMNGNIDTISVVASSGHKNLDKAALSAVRNAAPFRSSAGYGLADVTMEIPIAYRLN